MKITLVLLLSLAGHQASALEITNTQSMSVEIDTTTTPEPSVLDQYPDLDTSPDVEPDETVNA